MPSLSRDLGTQVRCGCPGMPSAGFCPPAALSLGDESTEWSVIYGGVQGYPSSLVSALSPTPTLPCLCLRFPLLASLLEPQGARELFALT